MFGVAPGLAPSAPELPALSVSKVEKRYTPLAAECPSEELLAEAYRWALRDYTIGLDVHGVCDGGIKISTGEELVPTECLEAIRRLKA